MRNRYLFRPSDGSILPEMCIRDRTNIQTGKELIESVTNPEVKKGMKEALSQLQSSLEKVQRQEKGLKKGFF